MNKIKADRPHPRNYPHTPTGYRHTDKQVRLVMALIAHYGSAVRGGTDGRTDSQTDGRSLPSTLSPSIIN